MNRIRRCKNKCIFCFVDQLPPGLRPALYIKDDDFLLSYMYGNFITLTNLSIRDIEKIVKYRLEPLHISIHSLDPDIRSILFGNKNHLKELKYFKILDNAGIRTNIQIVLVPGINDSKDLEHTIRKLHNEYKSIDSIGIIPVGVTDYNKNGSIRPFSGAEAKQTIMMVDGLKKRYGRKLSNTVFLSDEFYILAGKSFPSFKSYGKFFQINNGIGKSADFLSEIKDNSRTLIKKDLSYKKYLKILLITSEYGAVVLGEALDLIRDSLKNSSSPGQDILIDTKVVKNSFLGGNVKVTGLLSGADTIKVLNKINTEIYDTIFIPDSIFNIDGLTIDGINKIKIKKISKKIEIIPEDGKILIKEIKKLFLK
ncbi:MAG: DUF512 domain-containing protein [Actinomycetia bacterium]|nr:DUF512 domain-containing protein [Actinomycetes bacterium]